VSQTNQGMVFDKKTLKELIEENKNHPLFVKHDPKIYGRTNT